MRKSRTVPKYRKHKPTGQAVATLGGRDYYLGSHNSKTSIAEYDRLIAEWLANGRHLPHDDDGTSFTVNELISTSVASDGCSSGALKMNSFPVACFTTCKRFLDCGKGAPKRTSRNRSCP